MSSVDLLPALAERLERLVPEDGTLVHDWDDVLRRLAPAPRRRRRRLRLGVVALALFLLLAGIATGAYFALRGSGGDVRGLTIINGDRSSSAPAGTAILAIEPSGRLRVLWRCPHGEDFCGDFTSIAWSADGRKLAFTMDEIGGNSGYVGLHVVDTVSGRDLQLPRMGRGDTSLAQPRAFFERFRREALRQLGCPWPVEVASSADGTRLAYVCGLTSLHGRARIYAIGADGSSRRAVPTGTRTAVFPTFSPDGTRIAFASGAGPATSPAEHSSIYVVNLDGGGLRRLARHGTAPAWSPDGRTIAYRSTCGLRLVTPDGRDMTPAAMKTGCAGIRPPGFPAWSPDGKRLAFAMTSRPARGLYVVNVDGTGLRRVSSDPGVGVFGEGRPAWTPTPRVVHSHQVVFARQRCC